MLITLFLAVQLKLRQFNTTTMLGPYYQPESLDIKQVRDIAKQDKSIDVNIPSNVLAIHWNALMDQLSLISKEGDLTSELTTKREVLQESLKIFDPIGFATPVTIRSKLLIQKLWQMKIKWDEPLEADLNRENG